MFKKTMLLASMALALVAFAVPAVAQAGLTSGGATLTKGAKVTATSSNLVTTTSNGSLTCTKVTIHAELVSEGTPVLLAPSSVTTEGCLFAGVLPVTITDPSVSEITLENEEVEAAKATFESDIPAAGLSFCHLEGPVEGSYASGTSTIHISAALTQGKGTGTASEGCPTSGAMAGTFTLETSAGAAVTID